MKKFRIMVTRYGYTTIDAESENEALEKTKDMSEHAFDWSDFDEAQVVEELDENDM